MSALISTAVVASGAVAITPAAQADEKVTKVYSQLAGDELQDAVDFNIKQQISKHVGESAQMVYATNYGPGWCIDIAQPAPRYDSQYEVRKLDGMSGLVGYNKVDGGTLKIDPDVQKAAVAGTKRMLTEYNNGNYAEVKRINYALQALLSNHKETLDLVRGQIRREVAGSGMPMITAAEFTQWTGFEIKANFGNQLGQSRYYLAKSDSFDKVTSNVEQGEYVTILMPKNYNLSDKIGDEGTTQRIITIAQPGLKGFNPRPGGPNVSVETVTVTKPAEAVTTVTSTIPGKTVTKTVQAEGPTETAHVTERPERTVTKYVQPVHERTETVRATRTDVKDVTPTVTKTVVKRDSTETVTSTVTEAPETIVVEEREPDTTTTVYKGAEATVTETDAPDTVTSTKTAEPKTVTQTSTLAPSTVVKTVTAAPEATVTTTVENITHETIESTRVVERYFRKYEYAFDFSQKKDERHIEVEKLGDWKIDFIDDSNGLVKVTKSKDGKGLDIKPIKEGEGDVRIVIVDGEGNRHEYTIHVINKAQKEITEKDVVVNNHFFNITVAGASQEIEIPKGWTYEIEEGGAYITTEEKDGKIVVTPNEGVISATAKITVHEPGERPRNENNYIFNIAPDSKFDKHRVIGNSNAYKLEIEDAQGEPTVIQGEDIVASLEKNEQGVWVLTPKSDKTGKVVVSIKDSQGNTHQFTLDVRQGTNVLVDVVTKSVTVGSVIGIEADGGYELDFKQGEEIADWKKDNGKFIITPTGEGVIVANLFQKVDGERVLVGTYTIIATPAGAKVETQEVSHEIKNRQTVDITKGEDDHKIVVTEGKDNVTVAEVEKDGKTVTRLMPDKDFTGTIVVEEQRGDDVVVRYTINVVESEVDETTQPVNEDSKVIVNRNNDLQRLVVVEGENLLKNAPKDDQKQFIPEFVDGAEGTVVIELQNSRDLPIQRWILNLTPKKPSEFTYKITDRSEVKLTAPENASYKIVEGQDLIKVERNGNDIVVNPNKGVKGTAVVEVTNGAQKTRYVLVIDPIGGGANGDGTTGESTFKVSELGNFTVTVRNENTYEVVKGNEYVTVVDKDGKWILTPKEDTSGNFVTVIEKTKTGVVVNRHIIEITEQGRKLNFTEVRKKVEPKIDSWETPGKGNTLHIVRGYDLIENPEPDEHGRFNLKPIPGSTGSIVIEERDNNGNPIRIIEGEIPETSGGSSIEPPKISYEKNNGSITIIVDGKGGFGIEACLDKNPPKNAKDCKNLKPIDEKYIKDNGNGSYTIENGGIPDGTTALVITPTGNGIVDNNNRVIVDITIDNQGSGAGNVNVGSSDPKCIASLVGLASPLLLLIPLGILSQVHIPGLEGVRGQLNAAIKDANDRIQQGLGIYDHDRAQRAAGVQGAFAIENSQMIGMAAGALGVITAGLLIGDAVLRACGQQEATSSYQLGKATDNETLMYGSSGKPAESEAAKPEDEKAADEK
ncbi:hypothetical protein [Corynebacterium sp. HMSC074A01]|uniref:hypothetical protein n=1 Tax=Corynebacterium sp. HMSC074A01 TaxID=1715030 RepID=UPI0008A57498|nr:hypothetical protein [Corynebacterium sp. HMSC074A01]OHF40347.1 hypothetical protein HMPREF2550_00630 [Corynebacterium sp. HMSC074A01]